MTEPVDNQVTVTSADGTVGTVPKDQLAQAIDAGAHPTTEDEAAGAQEQEHEAELKEQYGEDSTMGGIARTVALQSASHAAGFARGAGSMMGLPTDAMATGATGALLGEPAKTSLRTTLQDLKALHPYQSGEGEVAGALAPGLLAPGAGVGGVAEEAGGAAEGLFGEGSGFLGRTAGRLTSGAVTGGVFSGTQAVNEAALGDEKLTAERLFATMAKGALFGAAAEGGLGAVTDAASSAWRGAVGEGGLSEAFARHKGEIGFRAGGGNKALAREADKTAGGAHAVGNRWVDEIPELVGKKSFGEVTPEDMPLAAEEGLKKHGKAIDNHVEWIDKVASERGEHPLVSDILGKIDSEVIAPMRADLKRSGGEAAVNKLEAWRDSIARRIGYMGEDGQILAPDMRMTFRQIRDARISADAMMKGHNFSSDLAGYTADFYKARNVLEDQLFAGADRVSEVAGGDAAASYRDSKRGYQAFKLLQKGSKNATSAGASNRLLSLTDNIMLGTGAKVGATIGSAFGPAGAVVGAAAGGGLGAIANKAVRSRFNFIAPDVLDKMAVLTAVQKKSSTMGEEIAGGMKNFFQSAKIAGSGSVADSIMKAHPGESKSAAMSRMVSQLSQPQDPQKFSEELGHLPEHAPKLSAALTATHMAATNFLTSKIPPGSISKNSLQPQLEKPRYSDADVSKFTRYLDTVKDPRSAVRDLWSGKITPEQVEALKAVYPSIYKEMQSDARKRLTDMKSPLPYEKRLQIGVLLDITSDPSLDRQFVSDMQASYAAPHSEDQQGAGTSTGKPIAISNDMLTMSQQAERTQ